MGGIEANPPIPTMDRMTTQFEHVACMHILGTQYPTNCNNCDNHQPDYCLEVGGYIPAPDGRTSYLASLSCTKGDLLGLTIADREDEKFIITHICNGTSIW
jgi:hypothetical protein